MKIKKLCTYENIQLENVDGSRPRGSWARLQKTFTDEFFDITMLPGIGVKLVNKEEGDTGNCFIVPFANIPYLVVERGSEQEETDRPVIRRRRRRKPETVEIPVTTYQEPEASDD